MQAVLFCEISCPKCSHFIQHGIYFLIPGKVTGFCLSIGWPFKSNRIYENCHHCLILNEGKLPTAPLSGEVWATQYCAVNAVLGSTSSLLILRQKNLGGSICTLPRLQISWQFKRVGHFKRVGQLDNSGKTVN